MIAVMIVAGIVAVASLIIPQIIHVNNNQSRSARVRATSAVVETRIRGILSHPTAYVGCVNDPAMGPQKCSLNYQMIK